jgi:thioredoxin reductase (NADPH)
MSDYLIRELDRYGVAVRDRNEIAALHGADGHLEAVTLKSGERLPFSFLFFFLGARPCTEWLDGAVARDANGFIRTGAAGDAENCSRQACRASSPPATSAPARRNAAPPPSAKDRWPSSSFTPTSPAPLLRK